MSQKKVVKRADGRYKVNYGSKQFYGKTRAEAEQKRKDYIAAEKAGLRVECADKNFDEYSKNWINIYCTQCGVTQRKQYESMIDFASESLCNKQMKAITVSDLQCMFNTLTAYSPSHVNKFTSLIRRIFKTALAEGAVLRNPMELVKRPKCKEIEGHRCLEKWERDLIISTYQEHDFGLCAMTMLYTGLRRGEALYIDIDRDVDFEKKTITVSGTVSFAEGNQPTESDGKTKAPKRVIPLFPPLEKALLGHHGLICSKEDGGLMSKIAFKRKYDSYINFLETKVNGCPKGWYGRKNEHKQLVAEGKELPPWKEVNIRCHDFRVDFCTRNYNAGVSLKTLQSWMGHSDVQMILSIYAKHTSEQDESDAIKFSRFISEDLEQIGGENP